MSPGFVLIGPRERALLVAEQLGLEQLLGQRRAVDGHEGLGGARAVGVDGARDQLLARPRLAEHQDVGLGPRRLLHQLEDPGHGRAAADHVLEPERRLQLLAQVAVLEPQIAAGGARGRRPRCSWSTVKVLGR